MTLEGVFAASITPLDEDGDLDEKALVRLVDHVAGGGASGILVLGSTGEAAFLPASVRRRLVEAVIAAVPVGVPVLAGVVASTIQDAIDEAVRHFEAGCAAVLLAPPLYGPAEPRKTEAYFHAVAQAVGGPLLAYHIPALTGAPVPPDVVGRLATAGDLAGVKDSGRDLEYLQSILSMTRGVDGFSTLTGTDTLLLASLIAGASGGITAGTGVAPHLTSALFEASVSGRLGEAVALQEQVNVLIGALRVGCFPAGFKHALQVLELASARPMPPTPPLTPEAEKGVEAALSSLGLATTSPELSDVIR